MRGNAVVLALAVTALAAPSAMAQSDLGLKRLGVAVAFVSPQDLDGTFSVGIFANHGIVTPRIGLESRIDFWQKSETFFGNETSVRDIAIGARGKYQFEVSHPKIRPFAGSGLALHLVHAKVTIPPQFGFPAMIVEDSSTKLGLDLGGGIATSIAPRADLLAELWYGIASDVNQFSLRIGMSRKLGA